MDLLQSLHEYVMMDRAFSLNLFRDRYPEDVQKRSIKQVVATYQMRRPEHRVGEAGFVLSGNLGSRWSPLCCRGRGCRRIGGGRRHENRSFHGSLLRLLYASQDASDGLFGIMEPFG